MAPLIDNPDEDLKNPIVWVTYLGHTVIVKILTPLKKNPNAADIHGYTPIYWAVLHGNEEIVKILAPLTGNSNAANEDGRTPSMRWP